VLCYFEGKSNSEAAAELGCPRGTVDSRLNAARLKLKGRFIRRGIAPTVAATILERLTTGDAVSAAIPGTIVRSAARLAVAFASGSAADGVISPAVAVLTHEVMHMFLMNKIKWAALTVLAVGILSTGTISTYRAMAGGERQTNPPQVEKADPKSDATTVARTEPNTNARRLRRLLKSPAGLAEPIENTTLRDALDLLSKKFDVSIRIEPGAFIRRGVLDQNEDPFKFYEAQVRLPIVRGMSLGEVLTDLLAQVNPKGGSPMWQRRRTSPLSPLSLPHSWGR